VTSSAPRKYPTRKEEEKREKEDRELSEDEFLRRKRVLKTVYLGLRCPMK
jgi:hypothetical protein